MKKIIFCVGVTASLAFCLDGLLLNARLAGGSFGFADYYHLSGPQLGLGVNVAENYGVILAVRSAEIWATPWNGDYMWGNSQFSPYLYLIRGFNGHKKLSAPAAYLFGSGNLWSGSYNIRYLQAGAGVKWTFYAVSPAFEAGVMLPSMSGHYQCMPYIRFSLEVGGWWRLGRKVRS
jgi:hypothetical protein